MQRFVRMLAVMTTVLCASCFGTQFTRGEKWRFDGDASTFGWPLYGAVVADYGHITYGPGHCDSVWDWLSAVFGWPVDFVVDTLVLPVDLAAGLAGYEKVRWSDHFGSDDS